MESEASSSHQVISELIKRHKYGLIYSFYEKHRCHKLKIGPNLETKLIVTATSPDLEVSMISYQCIQI